MTLFFGRSDEWSEDDGWEVLEAPDAEVAAQAFMEKWDLEDGDKFRIVRAAGDIQEFSVKSSRVAYRLPVVPGEPDSSPDSFR